MGINKNKGLQDNQNVNDPYTHNKSLSNETKHLPPSRVKKIAY